MNLYRPCHFGMEAVLKREIYDLGYDIIKTEDGRVTFEGDAEAVLPGECESADDGAGAFKGRRIPCGDV